MKKILAIAVLAFVGMAQASETERCNMTFNVEGLSIPVPVSLIAGQRINLVDGKAREIITTIIVDNDLAVDLTNVYPNSNELTIEWNRMRTFIHDCRAYQKINRLFEGK